MDSAEVWIKVSTAPHRPTRDIAGNLTPADPRDRTFTIPPGIKVRGGFQGVEAGEDERSITDARFTVLSGDFQVTPNDPTDDSYSVVRVPPTPPLGPNEERSSLLDHCVVTSGNANGSIAGQGLQGPRSSGGGLYAIGTELKVELVTFVDCSADHYGGGVSFRGDGEGLVGAEFTRCTFRNNVSGSGGGLALRLVGDPVGSQFVERTSIYNCVFSHNLAVERNVSPGSGLGRFGTGGGLWIGDRDSGIFVANCILDNNAASLQGSALYVGAEISGQQPPTPVLVHSSTFVRNRVTGTTDPLPIGGGAFPDGFAVYYGAPSGTSTPFGSELIRNSIVYGNQDANGALLQVGPAALVGTPQLRIEHSDVQGGAPGPGNIDANPDFVSASFFLIDPASPCRDSGTGLSGLPPDFPDLDDDPTTTILPVDWRVETLTSPPVDQLRLVGPATDMGAFEVQ